MLLEENTKPIPGLEEYSLTRNGIVLYTKTRHILSQICSKGYYYVLLNCGYEKADKPFKYIENGSVVTKSYKRIRKRFSVHRLMAKTFLINNDPVNKTEVNHIDGNPSNNCVENLEWVTPSENSKFAVNNNQRLDNTLCKVRDFDTGTVHHFFSVADAKRFMNVPINTKTINLIPKRFGQLIRDRYEFKFDKDKKPWFYENRTRKVSTKYLVEVFYQDGTKEEYYTLEELINRFDKLPSSKTINTIPEMVGRASREYPEIKFKLRSAHDEDEFPDIRKYKPKLQTKILACNKDTKQSLLINGLTKTAMIYKCSNKVIRDCINKVRPIDKVWYFVRANDEIAVKRLKEKLNID